jgi:hypothetical protein
MWEQRDGRDLSEQELGELQAIAKFEQETN